MNFCPYHNQNFKRSLSFTLWISLREITINLPKGTRISFEFQDGQDIIISKGLHSIDSPILRNKISERIEIPTQVIYDARKQRFFPKRVAVFVLAHLRSSSRRVGSGSFDLSRQLNDHVLTSTESVTIDCGQLREASLHAQFSLEFLGHQSFIEESHMHTSVALSQENFEPSTPRAPALEGLPDFLIQSRETSRIEPRKTLRKSKEKPLPPVSMKSIEQPSFLKTFAAQQSLLYKVRRQMEEMAYSKSKPRLRSFDKLPSKEDESYNKSPPRYRKRATIGALTLVDLDIKTSIDIPKNIGRDNRITFSSENHILPGLEVCKSIEEELVPLVYTKTPEVKPITPGYSFRPPNDSQRDFRKTPPRKNEDDEWLNPFNFNILGFEQGLSPDQTHSNDIPSTEEFLVNPVEVPLVSNNEELFEGKTIPLVPNQVKPKIENSPSTFTFGFVNQHQTDSPEMKDREVESVNYNIVDWKRDQFRPNINSDISPPKAPLSNPERVSEFVTGKSETERKINSNLERWSKDSEFSKRHLDNPTSPSNQQKKENQGSVSFPRDSKSQNLLFDPKKSTSQIENISKDILKQELTSNDIYTEPRQNDLKPIILNMSSESKPLRIVTDHPSLCSQKNIVKKNVREIEELFHLFTPHRELSTSQIKQETKIDKVDASTLTEKPMYTTWSNIKLISRPAKTRNNEISKDSNKWAFLSTGSENEKIPSKINNQQNNQISRSASFLLQSSFVNSPSDRNYQIFENQKSIIFQKKSEKDSHRETKDVKVFDLTASGPREIISPEQKIEESALQETIEIKTEIKGINDAIKALEASLNSSMKNEDEEIEMSRILEFERNNALLLYRNTCKQVEKLTAENNRLTKMYQEKDEKMLKIVNLIYDSKYPDLLDKLE